MATSRTEIDQGYMSNAIETVYTVPTNTQMVYFQLHICNTDTSTAYTFDMYLVPSGQSYAAQYKVWTGLSTANAVRAGETKKIAFNRAMSAGGTIQMIASAASKLTRGGFVVTESV
jgi:hypothetical protein